MAPERFRSARQQLHLHRALAATAILAATGAMLLLGCGREVDVLPDATAAATRPPTAGPTARPTRTPVLEPVIVIGPQSGFTDPEARLLLTVVVEDEAGQPQVANVTIQAASDETPLVMEHVSDEEIAIKAGWSPFTVVVSKPGYTPIHQPFAVFLIEDRQYELTVRLTFTGDTA